MFPVHFGNDFGKDYPDSPSAFASPIMLCKVKSPVLLCFTKFILITVATANKLMAIPIKTFFSFDKI
jgi:hypothetical protein